MSDTRKVTPERMIMEFKEKIPLRSEKTAFRVIDGEAVIVALQKQETIVLNPVGSKIWEMLDGCKDIGAIVQEVAAEFDVSYEAALSDTAAFVEDLAKREIVLLK